jgi:hypothetical protein
VREGEYIGIILFKMPMDGKWEVQSQVYEGTGKGVSPCKVGTVLSLGQNLLLSFCQAAMTD